MARAPLRQRDTYRYNMRICMYVCIYMYVYICIYIYRSMRTHIQETGSTRTRIQEASTRLGEGKGCRVWGFRIQARAKPRARRVSRKRARHRKPKEIPNRIRPQAHHRSESTSFCICQHMSAYVSTTALGPLHSAYVSISQHTSAYFSIRQHHSSGSTSFCAHRYIAQQ